MNKTFELAIVGGQCLIRDESGNLKEQRVDIGINQGVIEEIGQVSQHRVDRLIKADGLHVFPGLIDSQVHFREPGLEYKEDIASGSASAVMGGITAYFEMPNTKPPTVSALDLHDKVTRASGRSWCDFAFYMGTTADNVHRLSDLEKLPGCCGSKIFMGSSTGNLLLSEDQLIEEALKNTRRTVAVHCEDESRLQSRRPLVEEHSGQVHLHPEWRDVQSALMATQRLVQLAERTQRRVHVLHVTTAEEMEFLKTKKHLATVECTPQHLTLAAPDCYDRLKTLAQMNPPIRDQRHQDALWKAVNDKTVDVLGSDHAPHTLEEKNKPYPESPSGMTGVQTMLPIMLNHVHHGRLSLARLIELMAENPAKIFNLVGKGRIQVGYDADLTLVDLKAEKTITHAWIQSRCGWTPYDGMKVVGWPISTIVRGNIVMRDGHILGSPVGKPLRFSDT